MNFSFRERLHCHKIPKEFEGKLQRKLHDKLLLVNKQKGIHKREKILNELHRHEEEIVTNGRDSFLTRFAFEKACSRSLSVFRLSYRHYLAIEEAEVLSRPQNWTNLCQHEQTHKSEQTEHNHETGKPGFSISSFSLSNHWSRQLPSPIGFVFLLSLDENFFFRVPLWFSCLFSCLQFSFEQRESSLSSCL